MTSLYYIADTPLWYFICVIALFLFVGSMAVTYRAFRDRRNRGPIIIAMLNLTLISILLVVLTDCGRSLQPEEFREYSMFQRELFELPYLIYGGVELLTGVVLVSMSLEGSKYRLKNITVEAIQQAVDALPEGILIGSEDGVVRLSNLRINLLSRQLTGKVLIDVNKFWSYVVKEGKEQGDNYLLRLPSNEVWLFKNEEISGLDKTYYQITASNVTEQYAIIEELEQKNEHLQDIRRRMKAVSELSGDMFIAQEEADARAALHNQLGQVLLMGRHYLSHNDVTDPKMVYAATTQMNRFLLGEAEEPYEGEEDVFSQAVSMANSIGVKVDIKGNEPQAESARKILAQAVTECAANTVKHAEGDLVTVTILDEDEEVIIRIINNGKPPKGVIRESGGLLSLRRNVEAAVGAMKIEYEPDFVLELKLQESRE